MAIGNFASGFASGFNVVDTAFGRRAERDFRERQLANQMEQQRIANALVRYLGNRQKRPGRDSSRNPSARTYSGSARNSVTEQRISTPLVTSRNSTQILSYWLPWAMPTGSMTIAQESPGFASATTGATNFF